MHCGYNYGEVRRSAFFYDLPWVLALSQGRHLRFRPSAAGQLCLRQASWARSGLGRRRRPEWTHSGETSKVDLSQDATARLLLPANPRPHRQTRSAELLAITATVAASFRRPRSTTRALANAKRDAHTAQRLPQTWARAVGSRLGHLFVFCRGEGSATRDRTPVPRRRPPAATCYGLAVLNMYGAGRQSSDLRQGWTWDRGQEGMN